MMKILKTVWPRASGRRHLHRQASFLLKDRDLDIGHLWLHNGTWHFEYSDDYRRRADVRPVGSFPQLEEHYESKALWPFFVARIPGMGQPRVQRLIRDENLREENEIQLMLLKRFGERAIVNPYILVPQD